MVRYDKARAKARRKTQNVMNKAFRKTVKSAVRVRKGKRWATRARGKRAYRTPQGISYRHKAGLAQPYDLKPSKPFTVFPMKGTFLSVPIHSFDYDPETMSLRVRFWRNKIRKGRVVSHTPGSVYIYFQVPMKIYEGFLGASSKGRFFLYYIRGKYDFRPAS